VLTRCSTTGIQFQNGTATLENNLAVSLKNETYTYSKTRQSIPEHLDKRNENLYPFKNLYKYLQPYFS
jgi:predicted transcriptional regulator